MSKSNAMKKKIKSPSIPKLADQLEEMAMAVGKSMDNMITITSKKRTQIINIINRLKKLKKSLPVPKKSSKYSKKSKHVVILPVSSNSFGSSSYSDYQNSSSFVAGSAIDGGQTISEMNASNSVDECGLYP